MLTVTQQNRYVFECACMFVQCVLWGEGVWQGWGGGAAVDVLTACSHFCCVSLDALETTGMCNDIHRY